MNFVNACEEQQQGKDNMLVQGGEGRGGGGEFHTMGGGGGTKKFRTPSQKKAEMGPGTPQPPKRRNLGP
jgi:hypothetical protein